MSRRKNHKKIHRKKHQKKKTSDESKVDSKKTLITSFFGQTKNKCPQEAIESKRCSQKDVFSEALNEQLEELRERKESREESNDEMRELRDMIKKLEASLDKNTLKGI